jgi:hypothetical protein
MSKYICFTKLKHLIFWNGGSTYSYHEVVRSENRRHQESCICVCRRIIISVVVNDLSVAWSMSIHSYLCAKDVMVRKTDLSQEYHGMWWRWTTLVHMPQHRKRMGYCQRGLHDVDFLKSFEHIFYYFPPSSTTGSPHLLLLCRIWF